MAELTIDTKPLLRPHQVRAYEEDRKALRTKLDNRTGAHGFANGEHTADRGAVIKQLRRLEATMEPQIPKAFKPEQVDAAVRLERALRERWTEGMPSQAEMRKNPPGAVEKHMAWEKRNKPLVAEWKNLQLRLNVGNDDRSVTNIERYRPVDSTLNMDGAQVVGTTWHLPPPGAAPGVAFTDAQLQVLELIAPDIRKRLALMDNETRKAVKSALPAEKI
jgi:hypothetical protein